MLKIRFSVQIEFVSIRPKCSQEIPKYVKTILEVKHDKMKDAQKLNEFCAIRRTFCTNLNF